MALLRRDVIRMAIEHRRPPYVPWDAVFTGAGLRKAAAHFGVKDVEEEVLRNHHLYVSSGLTAMQEIGGGHLKDGFGVVWTKSPQDDACMVEHRILAEPTLAGYQFPDARDPALYRHIPEQLARYPDRFRIFAIGYTLYERAWTLRGMENLLMDFIENPEFIEQLFDAITEVNLAQIEMARRFDFDCIHFGDDWGHQHGLLIGREHWRQFIRPRLKRLFDAAKRAGKFVSVHSCGDIHELLDDLIDLRLDIANPFQPEAMDVFDLLGRYSKRVTFHGGLSTQETLPRGTVEDVRRQTQRLLDAGRDGGYIFAPGHGIGDEVPMENVEAMIALLHGQPGLSKST